MVAEIIKNVEQDRYHDSIVMQSIFGAIIMGADASEEQKELCCNVLVDKETENSLEQLLQRLWQVDQIKECKMRSIEEQKVEDNFLTTYKREASGRFVVTIPLRESAKDLGSSRAIALKRFMMLEKKLESNRELRQQYNEFMKEYEELDHMRRANRAVHKNSLVYYIPHHCITKKFRVVFDASCHTDRGNSLNDVQMLGEKLQKDLCQIVMRFRRHKIAINADVRMMFRQVKVAENQWDLQRIFWRANVKEPLVEYWLTVVTYGMTSSAHNAVRALIQCAREAPEQYSRAAQVIEQDFYMDDCITGAEDEEQALKLAREIDIVLKSGGFQLRKWKSNSKSLVRNMDSDFEDSVMLIEEEMTSVLGLKWLIQSDSFTYQVKTPEIDERITKRTIVSKVAQLYDPNGFISPVTIKGKILIQELWRRGIRWDEVVPDDIKRAWCNYWHEIVNLENFRIPRWLSTGRRAIVQVHGFSDASNRAYGAAIYVRVQSEGYVTVQLVVAKARVAPLRTMTIPRLELAGATLLAQLLPSVLVEMGWADCEYVLWTDSQVVLHWLKKVPCALKTFVANRVAEIQSKTKKESWRYVNTKDNPADLLSRGLEPRELVQNTLWLHGPRWLRLQEKDWPVNIGSNVSEAEMRAEMKTEAFVLPIVNKSEITIFARAMRKAIPILEYVSTLRKGINIISFVHRFVERARNRDNTNRPKRRRCEERAAPNRAEKNKAIMSLIKQEQSIHFRAEIQAIESKGQVQPTSKIGSLKPILDGEGILRVGGRLGRADESYEMKHPIIIETGSRLSWLIADDAHTATKHGAVQVMMQYIRQKFWICKLRNELRRFLHKCVVCARHNKQFEQQLMAELPKDRVSIGKPFLHCGVDYAGPFMVRMLTGPKKVTDKKVWVAIFVCFKTRAVHVDVVTDLTSIAFISCFERFICRRGRCERIYSDNGTAFVGAAKELRRAIEKWQVREVFEHMSIKGTEWRFMTPAAPHQGGIYEAAVKSMKYHLTRIVGMRKLSYEQFTTLLCEIEAILNSRPLTPLSDDVNDVQALTPGHFLVGEPLVVPLPFVTEEQPNTVIAKLWHERQMMVKHFWGRWREEYLATLQERKKWRREKENIKIGQLVVIKSELFPPAQWAMGRITELLKGEDGLVRNVVVQTSTTRLTRPVQKLCIIPIEPESHES